MGFPELSLPLTWICRCYVGVYTVSSVCKYIGYIGFRAKYSIIRYLDFG